MNFRRTCMAIICASVSFVDPVFGIINAVSSQPSSKKEEKPCIVELTIAPAAEPIPGLKYQLLPGACEQAPGNGCTLFNLAIIIAEKTDITEEQREKMDSWLDKAGGALPSKEVQEFLDKYASALHYTKLAARREYCEWELPVRSEGVDLELPFLSSLRQLSKILVLQISLDISNGQFDKAVENLQTGFAMARGCGKETLIQSLVGVAINALMAKQVEHWINTPGSPNLYWALADLPSPFIDMHRALQFERSILYIFFPQLLEVKKSIFTDEQMCLLTDELNRMIKMGSSNEKEAPNLHKLFETEVFVSKVYPKGKQLLASLGRTAEQIEATPAKQVMLIYLLDRWNYWIDEMCKWYGLPYWQANESSLRAEEKLESASKNKDPLEGYPFTEFVPSLRRAHFLFYRMNRQLAALRCIEAIRIYAANHNGNLPATLDDLEVPIPINPLTGKCFGYEVSGKKATLTASGPAGSSPEDTTLYRITIRE